MHEDKTPNRQAPGAQLILRLDWDDRTKVWMLTTSYRRHNGIYDTQSRPVQTSAAVDIWAAEMISLVVRDEMLTWLF